MFNEAHARAALAERARAREIALRHLEPVHRSGRKPTRPGVITAFLNRWFGERAPVDERIGALVPVPVVAIDMAERRRAAEADLRARQP
jgi:hypothetical protein